MSRDVYQFGDWVVEPDLNRIHRGSDQEQLEPLSMNMLRFLLRHPGETVSVDEILDEVWAGRVVESTAVHRAINHIRRALGDNPRRPRYIETIRKRGYRSIAPVIRLSGSDDVRVDSASKRSAIGETPSSTELETLRSDTPSAGRGGGNNTRLPVDDPAPVLAVLPFDNLSAETDLQHVSDGVSEEILQAIAKSVGVRVIGRSSSFQMRGTDKAAHRVAEVLKATHLLDGAIRSNGRRLRISVQLVDCASQSVLWSQLFERQVADFFQIQEDIARRIAHALRVTFVPRASVTTVDPVAFDLYLRARTGTPSYLGANDTDLLQAAVKRDASLGTAWAALALSLAIDAQDVEGAHSVEAVKTLRGRAREAAERALELDAGAALAHAALAALEPLAGAFERSHGHLMRALAAMPDEPEVLMRTQRWSRSVGRFAEALRYISEAAELDPLNPAVANDYATMLVQNGRVHEGNAEFDANRRRWPDVAYILMNPLFIAAYLEDRPRVDAFLEDLRVRGPHIPFVENNLPRLLQIHRSREEAGRAQLALMRQTLAQQGTVSLRAAGEAYLLGFPSEAYALMEQASFAHLLEPGGRLLAGDPGVHWLFMLGNRLEKSDFSQHDAEEFAVRFIGQCARFGLCDYWLVSGNWPDCAEILPLPRGFETEAQHARSQIAH